MKIAFGHFRQVRSLQWKIECCHHALEEVCRVCRFFVRWKRAIANHVFCSLRAFLQLEQRRFKGQISSWYQFSQAPLRRSSPDRLHPKDGQTTSQRLIPVMGRIKRAVSSCRIKNGKTFK